MHVLSYFVTYTGEGGWVSGGGGGGVPTEYSINYAMSLIKIKTKSAKSAYKKQRNLCTYLFRKAKRDYYSTLDTSNVTDNKKFWRMVKSLFSDKFLSNESITLVEGSEIFQDDTKVSETFNNFFSNAVKNLNIVVQSEFSQKNIISPTDPVTNAILRYEDHPSIIK